MRRPVKLISLGRVDVPSLDALVLILSVLSLAQSEQLLANFCVLTRLEKVGVRKDTPEASLTFKRA
jgi:hypothetical protein